MAWRGENAGVRAFLAFRLPDEAKQGIVEVQRAIESGAPGFFRWSSPGQMHLTLYFLGEMESVDTVIGAIEGGAFAARGDVRRLGLELSVGGLLVLPEPHVPRILAAGVGGETEVLRQLQQRVSDTVFALAEHKETRGFSPHVTIGRLKRGMPGTAKALKRALASASLPESAQFCVEELELVRSALGREGSVYETVHRFRIG